MKKRLYPLRTLAMLAMLAALSACGGGNDGDMTASNTAPPPVAPTPPPTPMLDAFFESVRAIIGMSSETAGPTALDGYTVTAPENTEPSPLS